VNNNKEDEKMSIYTVQISNEIAEFVSFFDAKAYAEKESWFSNLLALVRCPDGRTIKVKVGNVK
jgi:hypothetical protein